MDFSNPDPLDPHSHDPNPYPPSDDPAFLLILIDGQKIKIDVPSLQIFTRTTLTDCYVVSSGHGTSGPFTFSGAALISLLSGYAAKKSDWDLVEVISGDGFGTRILKEEFVNQQTARSIILADSIDSRPMTREQGLIRLIVPGETDDALRQVKWVSKIVVRRAI